MALRLSPHLTVMANAAQKAAKRLLRDFAEVEQLQVSVKGPSDFVSQADLRAEQTLKEELNKARPGYAFLMEESGASGSENWTWRWVVDPLDGTTNFLHGMPHWAISIGLERRLAGRHVEIAAGLIYAPAVDEMFWAEKGAGAFVNERRLRVSARREMTEAVFATGIPFARRLRAAPAAPSAARCRADAAGRRHPPVRRRGAGPRLGRGRPVRRLLGTGHQALGHGRRPAAGARGRRLCQRPAASDPLETGNVVAGNPHLFEKLREVVHRGAGGGAMIAPGRLGSGINGFGMACIVASKVGRSGEPAGAQTSPNAGCGLI